MRQSLSLSLVAAMLSFVAGAVAGDSQPSAKATAKVGSITILNASEMDYTPILHNVIKTPNQKDLFIDVSLECGLYTETKVDSLGGMEDRAEAETAVEVRVVIDPGTEAERIAEPGPVNFARRSQVLAAEFMGLLFDADYNICLRYIPPVLGESPGEVITLGRIEIDEECLQPETLELVLDTMNANSFNFIVSDLKAGAHVVEVQAKIDTFVDSTLDSGVKVRDKVDKEGFTLDEDENLDADDTLLTVDRGGKLSVNQIIIIHEEKLLITKIEDDHHVETTNGKHLTVERGYAGTTAVWHKGGTRIYVPGGANAWASIGKGSMTVETVRMIKNEDILLE